MRRDDESSHRGEDEGIMLCDLDAPVPPPSWGAFCLRLSCIDGSSFARRKRQGLSVVSVCCLLFFLLLAYQQTTAPFSYQEKGAPEQSVPEEYSVVQGQNAYVISADGFLSARRSTTGKVLWRLGAEKVWGVPISGGGLLFVNVQGGAVAAVAMDTGSIRWQYHLPISGCSLLAMQDGRVFVRYAYRLSPFEGGVVSLQAQTGSPLWRVQTLCFSHLSIELKVVVIENAGGLVEVRDARLGVLLRSFREVPEEAR